jgi:hypothetical protein
MQQDRAGFEHPDRLRAAAVHQRRDLGVGVDRDEAAAELVALADRISQASYSAPLWPSASSSSSITVTFTPFGVASE